MEFLTLQIEEADEMPIIDQVLRQVLLDRIFHHEGNLSAVTQSMGWSYPRTLRHIAKFNLKQAIFDAKAQAKQRKETTIYEKSLRSTCSSCALTLGGDSG